MCLRQVVLASFFQLAIVGCMLGSAKADTVTVNSLTTNPFGSSGVIVTGTASTPGTDTISSITFAWGDGQSTAGTITTPGASAAFEGIHTYAALGTYTVSVTAFDSAGDMGTFTTFLQIPASPVPERGSAWLLATGLAVLALFSKALFSEPA